MRCYERQASGGQARETDAENKGDSKCTHDTETLVQTRETNPRVPWEKKFKRN